MDKYQELEYLTKYDMDLILSELLNNQLNNHRNSIKNILYNFFKHTDLKYSEYNNLDLKLDQLIRDIEQTMKDKKVIFNKNILNTKD